MATIAYPKVPCGRFAPLWECATSSRDLAPGSCRLQPPHLLSLLDAGQAVVECRLLIRADVRCIAWERKESPTSRRSVLLSADDRTLLGEDQRVSELGNVEDGVQCRPMGSSQSGARQLSQHEARERAVDFCPGSCGKPSQRRRIGGEPCLGRRYVQQSARSRGS